jgi:hypothetical protein
MLLALVALLCMTLTSALAPGDVFAGHYVCGSAAWMLLYIERVGEGDEGVEAVFHFVYPGSTQHGAYKLKGSFETGGRVLKLAPGEWLQRSAGKVVPVGVMGLLSDDGECFSGEVLHMSCGRFEVNRCVRAAEPR